MKNIFKYTATLLLLFMSILPLFSQEVQDSTERNQLDNLIMRSIAHESLFPQERIYLHFDNNSYYLTENIWFKAYVVCGIDDKPTTLSKVLYVELVAPEGYVVRSNKYRIREDGTCCGMFELNTLLLSGYYEIRAYTRYMLNWGDDAIFSRVFPVFDKVNNGDWGFRNMLDRRRGFLLDVESDSSKVGLDREVEWITDKKQERHLRLFPESGHLVNGIESTVAFEVFGEEGINSNSSITLVADGEEVLTATPTHLGKGTFRFTPQEGTRYRVLLHNGEDEERFDLPEIEKEGAVISVDNSNENIVGISVKNNLNVETELGCAVIYRGTPLFYERFSSDQRDLFFAIDKKTLREGVNRVVLFASDSIPLAERQFFVTHDSITADDRPTARLVVNSTGTTLQPHERVSLTIEREDGKPIEGNNLSVAVTDAENNLTTSFTYNIYSYMLLGSEIKGYIPNAAQYFDPKNKDRNTNLDLIMLTHGWTSYDWDKLSVRNVSLQEPIERGITISGRFVRKRPDRRFGHLDKLEITNRPNTRVELKISYNDSTISEYTFRTGRQGFFNIQTDDFTGKRIAKLTPDMNNVSPRDSVFAFVLDRYFSPEMRLFDYWERNCGLPLTAEEKREQLGEMIRTMPFEYLLSQVEVVSRVKKEGYYRPPRSEMRLDFLDEWEYAQDITYLCNTTDSWDLERDYDYYRTEPRWQIPSVMGEPTLSALDRQGISSLNNLSPYTARDHGGMPGFRRGFTELNGEEFLISDPAYRNSLNAADILRSAFWRHNLNWCYWIQSMVVDGEYHSDSIPKPDFDYIKGVDPVKMMNFSEIIIRSDENTRNLFGKGRRTASNRRRNRGAYDYSDYYDSFVGQMPIGARSGKIEDAPDPVDLGLQAHFITDAATPNYVACFVPNRENILTPMLTHNSSARYTMVYGYTESKEFYSPDYSTLQPDSSNTDYRRTLLWVPRPVVNDGKIEIDFYNNSTSKKFIVDIEGYSNGVFYSNDTLFVTREPDAQELAQREIEQSNVLLDGLNTPQLLIECFRKNEVGRRQYQEGAYEEAFLNFYEAATFNYPDAIFNCGVCYLTGNGVEQDSIKGFQSFRKAANLNVDRALHNLASCYLLGIGTTKNDTLAVKYYTLSAEKGYAVSKSTLAGFYLRGDVVGQDSTEAYRLYSEAAEQGEPQALYQMAEYWAKADSVAGLSKRELRRQPAIEYYKSAAEKGHVLAQYKLARFYETGYYVKRSKKRAFNWYLHAANNNHPQAIERVAYCYEKGWGTKKNERFAANWYRLARERGSALAREKMEWYDIFRFFK